MQIHTILVASPLGNMTTADIHLPLFKRIWHGDPKKYEFELFQIQSYLKIITLHILSRLTPLFKVFHISSFFFTQLLSLLKKVRTVLKIQFDRPTTISKTMPFTVSITLKNKIKPYFIRIIVSLMLYKIVLN